MNSFLDPVGARPPVVYWRRRALFAAAMAVLIMLVAKSCGGAAPDLRSKSAAQGPVPLLSTYTPTPRPTEKIIDAGDEGLPGVQGGSGVSNGGGIGSGSSSTSTAKNAGIGSGSGSAGSGSGSSGSASSGSVGSGSVGVGEAAGPAKPLATVGPATTVAPKPAATATPKPVAPKAVPVAVTTCKKSAIQVKLRTDKTTYSVKKSPQLFIAVKNVGDVGCLVDLGSQALSLVVKSGADRVWSSDDCQGKGTSDIRLLKPGQALEARSVWSTVRSEKGCPKGMAKAKPGTYVLEGSAGGVKAKKRAVFHIV